MKIRHAIVKLIAPNLYRGEGSFPRPMIDFISKNCDGADLVGVEIGVSFGANAESILRTLPIKKLYLIDPYKPYVEVNGSLFDTRPHFSVAKQKLSQFKRKITFVKKKSSEAVDDVPDNLDFVYIDGNHSFEYVKKDLELYFPKIKDGGVIGGHDFNSSFLGICKAVIEFAHKNNITLHGKKVDWWLVK